MRKQPGALLLLLAFFVMRTRTSKLMSKARPPNQRQAAVIGISINAPTQKVTDAAKCHSADGTASESEADLRASQGVVWRGSSFAGAIFWKVAGCCCAVSKFFWAWGDARTASRNAQRLCRSGRCLISPLRLMRAGMECLMSEPTASEAMAAASLER